LGNGILQGKVLKKQITLNLLGIIFQQLIHADRDCLKINVREWKSENILTRLIGFYWKFNTVDTVELIF